jgi:nucleotide-binding universal stress UspA family protein
MSTAPILVGFDPDSADRAPVHFAIAAARVTGAPLVVGAVHADPSAVGQLVHGHVEGELLNDADQPLDHIRRELADEGVEAECRALPGWSTSRALHEEAERLGAGLLVVGSARQGLVGRLRPGSTATRLLHGAPCPVAVVPHDWQRGGTLQTIGVAYVDTPEGHEALDGALALARRSGAKLRVLSAARPHAHGTTPHAERLHEADTYGASERDLQADVEQAVAAATGSKPRVDIEPDVSIQEPADFLIAASQMLDLLICGSRGYGPSRAVLLGGVSRRVTAEAHCPVIVLVREAERGLEALIGDQAEASV